MPRKGYNKPTDLLTHYRWVVKHPDRETNSPVRRQLQTEFKERFGRFMEVMTKLETLRAAKRPTQSPATQTATLAAEAEPDEGGERVMEKLAAEWAEYRAYLAGKGLLPAVGSGPAVHG